jgi:hypothetical protein
MVASTPSRSRLTPFLTPTGTATSSAFTGRSSPANPTGVGDPWNSSDPRPAARCARPPDREDWSPSSRRSAPRCNQGPAPLRSRRTGPRGQHRTKVWSAPRRSRTVTAEMGRLGEDLGDVVGTPAAERVGLLQDRSPCLVRSWAEHLPFQSAEVPLPVRRESLGAPASRRWPAEAPPVGM